MTLYVVLDPVLTCSVILMVLPAYSVPTLTVTAVLPDEFLTALTVGFTFGAAEATWVATTLDDPTKAIATRRDNNLFVDLKRKPASIADFEDRI
jgi:hypothetical protein